MTCTHYWVLDPAQYTHSRGVCSHCGEVRLFDNRPPSLYFPVQLKAGMTRRTALKLTKWVVKVA